MSLQVWLPLNGNLNNQGLTPITLRSGTPTYTSGKIGKCLASGNLIFDVSNSLISNIGQTNEYSICCWCKNLNSSTANRWVFFIGSGTGGSRGLYESNSTTARHWAYSGTGINITSPNVIDGKWHHIVFTSQGSTVKLYVDGTFTGQVTNAKTDGLTVNLFNIIANDYNLNDFRIYDHCLSAKEVKEISKGLALHYKLDNNGCGSPNLITGTPTMKLGDRSSAVVSVHDGMADWAATTTLGWNSISTVPIAYSLVKNQTVVVSFDVQSDDYVELNKLTDRGLYLTMDLCTATSVARTKYGGLNMYSTQLSSDWKRITYKTTLTDAWFSAGSGTIDSTTRMFVHIFNYSLYRMRVKNIKLEINDKATSWCPHTSDAEYTSLGFNSITEYDCSGYGYDGTKKGTIMCNNTSPRYETSSRFGSSGSSYVMQNNSTNSPRPSDAITLSAWFNAENVTSGKSIIENFESGGVGLYISNTTAVFQIFANGGYVNVIFNGVSANQWYHIVGTYDRNKLKLYLNGELKASKDFTYPITYNANTPYAVGCNPGANGTYGGEDFIGAISDVRVYTTALSATDVKELYQTSASIDKNGNLYCYELKEG